jgi:hypothetical protein
MSPRNDTPKTKTKKENPATPKYITEPSTLVFPLLK